MQRAAIMLLQRTTCAISVIVAISAFGEETQTLTARWLLNVERGELIENGVIVVKGERIAAVGRKGEVAVEGALRDLGEVTLMPGMIDAHVHLTLGGNPEANARATLQAGFTTVQDLGALNYKSIEI